MQFSKKETKRFGCILKSQSLNMCAIFELKKLKIHFLSCKEIFVIIIIKQMLKFSRLIEHLSRVNKKGSQRAFKKSLSRALNELSIEL